MKRIRFVAMAVGATIVAGAWLPVEATAQTKRRQAGTPPAQVQVQVPAPIRPEERYGRWTVSLDGNFTFANTQNESGSIFGVLCSKDCLAYINPRIACTNGEDFPALVNSSAGAFSVTLRCAVIDEIYLLTMPLTSLMIDSMEIGGELGVAFPMESGRFQVARFSLTGALKAAARALDLSEAGRTASGEQGLRDQTL